MDVKICDRCGKELMPINVFDKSLRGYLFRKGRYSYKAVRVENGDDFTFRHRKSIELCPSCYHELKRTYVLYDDADKRDANLLEAYRLLTNCLCINTDGYSCDLNQESANSVLNDVIVLLAKALEE